MQCVKCRMSWHCDMQCVKCRMSYHCDMQCVGVTMTLFCTHGRVSGPSSLLDLEVMAPREYSVPCQF